MNSIGPVTISGESEAKTVLTMASCRRDFSIKYSKPSWLGIAPTKHSSFPATDANGGRWLLGNRQGANRNERAWSVRRNLSADASAGSFETLDTPARAALLEDLRAAGVRVERAPPAALEDFIASHAAPRDEPELRQKGRYSKRN